MGKTVTTPTEEPEESSSTLYLAFSISPVYDLVLCGFCFANWAQLQFPFCATNYMTSVALAVTRSAALLQDFHRVLRPYVIFAACAACLTATFKTICTTICIICTVFMAFQRFPTLPEHRISRCSLMHRCKFRPSRASLIFYSLLKSFSVSSRRQIAPVFSDQRLLMSSHRLLSTLSQAVWEAGYVGGSQQRRRKNSIRIHCAIHLHMCILCNV